MVGGLVREPRIPATMALKVRRGCRLVSPPERSCEILFSSSSRSP
jgi:hypothetical protein